MKGGARRGGGLLRSCRRRGAVRAAYAAFANARDAERCAAAAEAMRNGSVGADAVARAVRRERRRPHR